MPSPSFPEARRPSSRDSDATLVAASVNSDMTLTEDYRDTLPSGPSSTKGSSRGPHSTRRGQQQTVSLHFAASNAERRPCAFLPFRSFPTLPYPS